MARIWNKAKDKDVAANLIYFAPDEKYYLTQNADGTYSNEISVTPPDEGASDEEFAAWFDQCSDLFVKGAIVFNVGDAAYAAVTGFSQDADLIFSFSAPESDGE